MGQPAARISDMHTCPMSTGPVPHVGGPIAAGAPTVLIGGLPAARVGDMATCVGPPDTIVKGNATVLICGMPAARMGDSTAHGGVIVAGCPTVLIGEDAGGAFVVCPVTPVLGPTLLSPAQIEEKNFLEKFLEELNNKISQVNEHPVDAVIGIFKSNLNLISDVVALKIKSDMWLNSQEMGLLSEVADKLELTESANWFRKKANDKNREFAQVNLPKFELNETEQSGSDLFDTVTIVAGVLGLGKALVKKGLKQGIKTFGKNSIEKLETNVIQNSHIEELTKNGIKFTPENVLATGKNAKNQVVFLEIGNSDSGLQHILERHAVDFANKGTKIPL